MITSSPSVTNEQGIVVNMPALTTERAVDVNYNGVLRLYMTAQSNASILGLEAFDNTSGTGCRLIVGRNSNGSTPAAGSIFLYDLSGDFHVVWVDNADQMRILKNAIVTNANDTGGTVIGSQTSMAEAKHISDDLSVLDEVMSRIRQGAEAVRRFTYKSGAFGGERFEGVVTDEAPAYGLDRDKDHPQGKSLNEINIFGDLLRFSSWAMDRIEELTARVADLESR